MSSYYYNKSDVSDVSGSEALLKRLNNYNSQQQQQQHGADYDIERFVSLRLCRSTHTVVDRYYLSTASHVQTVSLAILHTIHPVSQQSAHDKYCRSPQ